MRNLLTLLSAILFSVTLPAETYTIVFKSGNGANDSGSKVTELSKIIFSATDNCVTSVSTANNIYNAGSERGSKVEPVVPKAN